MSEGGKGSGFQKIGDRELLATLHRRPRSCAAAVPIMARQADAAAAKLNFFILLTPCNYLLVLLTARSGNLPDLTAGQLTT